MNYRPKFLPSARKEWEKPNNCIQKQLKKKLKERLINPRISGSELTKVQNMFYLSFIPMNI